MKRAEQIAHLHKLSLADLQKEVGELTKKIQNEKMGLAFGKTKEVRTLRNTKRQLARTLTLANQKVRAAMAGSKEA